ncbi:TetR/AcrR family transcriptional regulator C-terminal domain-containing protein [Paenibacillus sp. FSL F4-0122]|uniref:TetR/AcrR family transcriptional regulator C-terminal domain-containing protein n=1 Tax=Paenibacillus sp. FSL F4-0122 TaxID=2921371 RepID=UPI00404692EE
MYKNDAKKKKYFRSIARDKCVLSNWREQYPKATNKQLQFTYEYIVNGSIAIIEQWLIFGMHEDHLYVANFY